MSNLTKLVGSSPRTPGWTYRSLPASPQSPYCPPPSETGFRPLFSASSATGFCPHHRPHICCVHVVGLLTRLTMTLAEPRNLAEVRCTVRSQHRVAAMPECTGTETLLPGETKIRVCVRFFGSSKSGFSTDSRVQRHGVDVVQGVGKTDVDAPRHQESSFHGLWP